MEGNFLIIAPNLQGAMCLFSKDGEQIQGQKELSFNQTAAMAKDGYCEVTVKINCLVGNVAEKPKEKVKEDPKTKP